MAMNQPNLYPSPNIPARRPDEQSLVKALHQGDPYACDDLVKHFSSKVYNVALRLTGHPADAEEVLQETFINACKGAGNFKGQSSLGTWLYRIATNNGLMRLRRNSAQLIPLENAGDDEGVPVQSGILQDWNWNPEAVTLSSELRYVMDEAVNTLPNSLRPVFILRDLEGLSTKEVANTLNISESNVKVRLHRARFMLREKLALYFNEQTDREKPAID
jgi:RNA polymerase sigma-70 factor (ECF subfamily)